MFFAISVIHTEYIVEFKIFLLIFKASSTFNIFEYRHLKIAFQPRTVAAICMQLYMEMLGISRSFLGALELTPAANMI